MKVITKTKSLFFLFVFLAPQFGSLNLSVAREKRKTTIDFEDELIEGELKKPDVLTMFSRKQFNFRKLIKLRENFLPEMQRTSEDINRARGKN